MLQRLHLWRGGGGASAVGGDAPSNGTPDLPTGAGVGGDGFTTTILGSSQAFGGGGGGWSTPGPNATSGGDGGLGGGGAGLPGPSGTAKTGGTGFNAGGSTTSSGTRGGDGGALLVVVEAVDAHHQTDKPQGVVVLES